eukprot:TRINITY_DN74935_c0_g1_i1.p1 TRINITY_DN74935_c0_g1~~TRINITY_DN74935_c0_g1_i1.p1  ORF type:complete len:1205 (-),score=202.49 TRINITY_DN74935_c0_g1_i1:26-3640(-)
MSFNRPIRRGGSGAAAVLRDVTDYGERMDATRELRSLGERAGLDEAVALSGAVFQPHGGMGLQWHAAEGLGELGIAAGAAGGTALARTLSLKGPDSDPYMRMGAAVSLGKVREAAFGAGSYALSSAVVEDNDVYVRRNAAASLGNVGGQTAGVLGAAALSKALKVDSDVNVRCHAADSLGKLGAGATNAGTAALRMALETDVDMGVRLHAARAMGRIGYVIGVDGALGLIKAYRTDKACVVRENARNAIDTVCASAITLLHGEKSHSFLRGQAALVIGQLGEFAGIHAVETLAVATVREQDKYVRRRAVESLGKLDAATCGNLGVLALCRASKKDKDIYVKIQAEELLVRMRGQNAELTDYGDAPQQLQELLGDDLPYNPRLTPEEEEAVAREFAKAKAKAEAEAAAEAAAAAAAAKAAAEEKARQEAQEREAAEKAAREREAFERAEQERLEKERAEKERSERKRALKQATKNAAAMSRAAARLAARKPAGASGPCTAERSKDGVGVKPTDHSMVPSDVAWVESAESDFEWDGLSPIAAPEENSIEAERAAAVFRKFARDGKMAREHLSKTLRLIGHHHMIEGWMQELVDKTCEGPSSLDFVCFTNVLGEYQRMLHAFMKDKFNDADPSNSGEIDAAGLTQVLGEIGICLPSGVVRCFIREVNGSIDGRIGPQAFRRVLDIMRYRAGLTRREFSYVRRRFTRCVEASDGMLSSVGVSACLQSLGYPVNSEVAKELMAHACIDTSRASFVEFLNMIRTYRGDEGVRIRRAVVNQDKNKNGVIDVDELPGLFADAGYMISSPSAVREAAAKCGLSEKSGLIFEDLCALLVHVRESAGFSADELHEVNEAFAHFDTSASSRLMALELESAMRWLGYPSNFDRVWIVLGELDIDYSAEIDEVQFLRVVAKHRNEEFNAVRSHLLKASGEDNQNETLTADASPLLREALCCNLAKVDFSSLLASLGFASPESADAGAGRKLALEASRCPVSVEVDVWRCAALVCRYREAVRAEHRANWGFTAEDVATLREKYTHCSDYASGEGVRVDERLTALLAEFLPSVKKYKVSRDALNSITEDADKNGDTHIDFREFLRLAHFIRDCTSRHSLRKQQRAMMRRAFSCEEFKQLRHAFRTCDVNDDGFLSHEKVLEMGISIFSKEVANGTEQELKALVSELDTESSSSIDFPEFLELVTLAKRRPLTKDNSPLAT